MHYVENANLDIAAEILCVVLKHVDFEAAAKYCIDTHMQYNERHM